MTVKKLIIFKKLAHHINKIRNARPGLMAKVIIPLWLQDRVIDSDDLEVLQNLAMHLTPNVFKAIDAKNLKYYHENHSKDFYRLIRVLSFYGVKFVGSLSSYTYCNEDNPELISIPTNLWRKEINHYLINSYPLIKSMGFNILKQFHGVPKICMESLLESKRSIEDINELLNIKTANSFEELQLSYKEKKEENEIPENIKSFSNDKVNLYQNYLFNELIHNNISILNIRDRTYRTLVSENINTIEELILKSNEELLKINSFDKDTLKEKYEITIELKKFGLNLRKDSEQGNINKVTPQKLDTILDEEILNKLRKRIDDLFLSVRLRSISSLLKSAQIVFMWQLIELTEKELVEVKYLGSKSINLGSVTARRIKDFVENYGFKLGSKFRDNHEPKKNKLTTRIDNLVLSVRARNVIQTLNIEFLWQLIQVTEKELLKVKNSGRKTVMEIKIIVDEYGFKLGSMFNEEEFNSNDNHELTNQKFIDSTLDEQTLNKLKTKIELFLFSVRDRNVL